MQLQSLELLTPALINKSFLENSTSVSYFSPFCNCKSESGWEKGIESGFILWCFPFVKGLEELNNGCHKTDAISLAGVWLPHGGQAVGWLKKLPIQLSLQT